MSESSGIYNGELFEDVITEMFPSNELRQLIQEIDTELDKPLPSSQPIAVTPEARFLHKNIFGVLRFLESKQDQ